MKKLDKVKIWIKEHPYIVAGIVVFWVIVLVGMYTAR